EEDLQGRPFVGASGELLNKMLAAIDISRKDVYITNIVKCRPPRNRTPKPEEIAKCLPFLEHQLRIIDPPLILAMDSRRSLPGPTFNLILPLTYKVKLD
ncbi:MAG TPA: hypothetical protein ENL06_00125, partial [Candidatus Portnoybacteria bacterium]|nr:hypothetical protein [Candidatus Portnoybacteria bacterium]